MSNDALLAALAPAVLGAIVAVVLLLQARRNLAEPMTPGQSGPFFLLLAMPTTAVVLAVLAVRIAADVPAAATPLLVLGVAAFVQAVAQGLVGARRVGALVAEPGSLGATILLLALPEAVTIGAFAWGFLAVGAA